jgi:hypothetical protein
MRASSLSRFGPGGLVQRPAGRLRPVADRPQPDAALLTPADEPAGCRLLQQMKQQEKVSTDAR